MPAAWARRVAVVAALIVSPVLVPSPAFAELQNLHPGQFAQVDQDVPVTVVLVGLEPAPVPPASTPAGCWVAADREPRCRSHDPLPRAQRCQGPRASAIGLRYRYDYRAVFADDSFEDALFGYLASIAIGPIPGGTVFQQAYSAHPLAAEPIPASYIVDATAAERWLAAHAGPMLNVDTTRPTVFLINWHGRPDFVFHTYGFLNQPGYPVPLGPHPRGPVGRVGRQPA